MNRRMRLWIPCLLEYICPGGKDMNLSQSWLKALISYANHIDPANKSVIQYVMYPAKKSHWICDGLDKLLFSIQKWDSYRIEQKRERNFSNMPWKRHNMFQTESTNESLLILASVFNSKAQMYIIIIMQIDKNIWMKGIRTWTQIIKEIELITSLFLLIED